MDSKDLQSTRHIGDTNVNLPIEPTKTPKGGVNAVRPVSGCHDNDMCTLFEPIHQGQQLRDNATLHLTVGLEEEGEEREEEEEEEEEEEGEGGGGGGRRRKRRWEKRKRRKRAGGV